MIESTIDHVLVLLFFLFELAAEIRHLKIKFTIVELDQDVSFLNHLAFFDQHIGNHAVFANKYVVHFLRA